MIVTVNMRFARTAPDTDIDQVVRSLETFSEIIDDSEPDAQWRAIMAEVKGHSAFLESDPPINAQREWLRRLVRKFGIFEIEADIEDKSSRMLVFRPNPMADV